MSTSNNTDLLIRHLLDRIERDPRLAYFFDPFTESMALLTAAYATREGIDVEGFRETYYARLRYERPKCADCREVEALR